MDGQLTDGVSYTTGVLNQQPGDVVFKEREKRIIFKAEEAGGGGRKEPHKRRVVGTKPCMLYTRFYCTRYRIKVFCYVLLSIV